MFVYRNESRKPYSSTQDPSEGRPPGVGHVRLVGSQPDLSSPFRRHTSTSAHSGMLGSGVYRWRRDGARGSPVANKGRSTTTSSPASIVFRHSYVGRQQRRDTLEQHPSSNESTTMPRRHRTSSGRSTVALSHVDGLTNLLPGVHRSGDATTVSIFSTPVTRRVNFSPNKASVAGGNNAVFHQNKDAGDQRTHRELAAVEDVAPTPFRRAVMKLLSPGAMQETFLGNLWEQDDRDREAHALSAIVEAAAERRRRIKDDRRRRRQKQTKVREEKENGVVAVVSWEHPSDKEFSDSDSSSQGSSQQATGAAGLTASRAQQLFHLFKQRSADRSETVSKQVLSHGGATSVMSRPNGSFRLTEYLLSRAGTEDPEGRGKGHTRIDALAAEREIGLAKERFGDRWFQPQPTAATHHHKDPHNFPNSGGNNYGSVAGPVDDDGSVSSVFGATALPRSNTASTRRWADEFLTSALISGGEHGDGPHPHRERRDSHHKVDRTPRRTEALTPSELQALYTSQHATINRKTNGRSVGDRGSPGRCRGQKATAGGTRLRLSPQRRAPTTGGGVPPPSPLLLVSDGIIHEGSASPSLMLHRPFWPFTETPNVDVADDAPKPSPLSLLDQSSVTHSPSLRPGTPRQSVANRIVASRLELDIPAPQASSSPLSTNPLQPQMLSPTLTRRRSAFTLSTESQLRQQSSSTSERRAEQHLEAPLSHFPPSSSPVDTAILCRGLERQQKDGIYHGPTTQEPSVVPGAHDPSAAQSAPVAKAGMVAPKGCSGVATVAAVESCGSPGNTLCQTDVNNSFIDPNTSEITSEELGRIMMLPSSSFGTLRLHRILSPKQLRLLHLLQAHLAARRSSGGGGGDKENSAGPSPNANDIPTEKHSSLTPKTLRALVVESGVSGAEIDGLLRALLPAYRQAYGSLTASRLLLSGAKGASAHEDEPSSSPRPAAGPKHQPTTQGVGEAPTSSPQQLGGGNTPFQVPAASYSLSVPDVIRGNVSTMAEAKSKSFVKSPAFSAVTSSFYKNSGGGVGGRQPLHAPSRVPNTSLPHRESGRGNHSTTSTLSAATASSATPAAERSQSPKGETAWRGPTHKSFTSSPNTSLTRRNRASCSDTDDMLLGFRGQKSTSPSKSRSAKFTAGGVGIGHDARNNSTNPHGFVVAGMF